ncbi:camp receptor [Pyrenophora seminiperda CCB06]|uniref:Camp receptor n=1 Tax=Pyrenophora seminiperda CCB06 TaxID=1302712 RepID=A0A3M7MCK6_9PLEO|nr:camp receptor [Pyrenophora seminiperda CCB06]
MDQVIIDLDPNAPFSKLANMTPPLSHGEGFALVMATRASSVLSVLGSMFIISTFVYFPFFRKPINRLVFFATFGNMLTNVATMMSTAVLPKGTLAPSGLCQFQGLLIQWFMVADSFWVLCMATNVLLVFFYGYDAQQIRHLEKWYFAFSYGVPAVPAITYVILNNTRHRIIGSATLWCWVGIEHEWMRIAFFYAPAWIWKRRVELHSITRKVHPVTAIQAPSRASDNQITPLSGINNIFVKSQITQDIICRSTSPNPGQGSATSSGYRADVVAVKTSADATKGPNRLSLSFPGAKRTPEGHAAAMAYFQVAFLMFLALFVVWLPSSINRMCQFIHNVPSFALQLTAAIVLPLQGAWNAAIYISTTRKECKRAWGMTMSKLTGKPLRYQSQRDAFPNETMSSSQETRDSTTELSLDDFLKEGGCVRYSESYSTDGAEDAACHCNRESV